MGQALYRKYRSKSLDEIVGQEHITATLKRALETGRLSHAYLFTGPRGVGKTSIARILAHAMNDLPYTDEAAHLDIIEIDAASNRRIDEIRDLRDKVSIAPAAAKYKVYIIDEVHMLTKEAFNALLKTLEEPPAHVIFILATTEMHKLPATIVSRTQRFAFRPVAAEQVAAHLQTIAKQEKIKIDAEALELIARYGEGSFRDSISLLDQAGNAADKIDAAIIRDMLGIAPETAIAELIAAIAAGDPILVINRLNSLFDSGHTAGRIAKQIAAELRQQLLARTGTIADGVLFDLLERLIEVPASAQADQAIEIALLRAASATPGGQAAATPAAPVQKTAAPKAALVAAPKQTATPVRRHQPLAVTAPVPVDSAETETETEAEAEAEAEPNSSAPAQPFDLTAWPAVVEALKRDHNTLYSIAKLAQATLADDGRLCLSLPFAFHQKRLHEAKNRQIILATIKTVTGRSSAFICQVVTATPAAPAPASAKTAARAPQPAESAPPTSVSNIFGGGEVLS